MRDNQSDKNNKIINHPVLLAISIILIIAIIAGLCVYEIGKQRQLRDLEAQAQSFCERYGLENVSVKIKGPSNYEGYKMYDMHITGSGVKKMGYPRLKNMIRAIEKYDAPFENSILIASFNLDGEEYWVSAYDGALYRGIEEIYPTNKSSHNSGSSENVYPNTGKSGGLKNSTGFGASDKKDPYNAKDYRDPEDFYEDYYDDFYDYEDAEDYYYDNCD